MRLLPISFIAALLAPALTLADFLEDVSYISTECLPALHYDHIKSSLHIFAKSHNLSDDEMAERLLYIADHANEITNRSEVSMARRAIGGIVFFQNAVSALPALEHYITIPETQAEAFSAYGRITKFDNRFFNFTSNAVHAGTIDKNFYRLRLCSAIENQDTATWKASAKGRLVIRRFLVNCEVDWFDSAVYMDRFLCNKVEHYTNSLERVRALTHQLSLINNQCDRIAKVSCYRGDWNGAHLSNEDWVKFVESACQSEIARVKNLPDGKRVEVTKLLDAQIAAIEAEEARAARRAAWRRRLSIGGFVLTPLMGIAAVIIAAQRRNKGNGYLARA